MKQLNESCEKPPARAFGKHTITILNNLSGLQPVLSDQTKNERSVRSAWASYRGSRPLHRTTLTFDRSKPKTDYLSFYKYYFSGISQEGVRRPPSCPSLLISHIDLGENDQMQFQTIQKEMFPPKHYQPLSARKNIEKTHRINNTAGLQMMDITDMNTRPSYKSAYGSSHNALGRQLGNGVPHYRKKPPKFNVLTGEALKTSVESVCYRKKSGNRTLSQHRRKGSYHEVFKLG